MMNPLDFNTLIAMDVPTLDDVMAAGVTPQPENLAGYEFRGFNPPKFARWLGFQKFIKGFWLESNGALAGYNRFVRNPRGGPGQPWVAKDPSPKGRHGFYDVLPVVPGTRYDDFPHAVLLDYGSGRNSAWNPESRIRDFLVQVDAQNPDLYLGKAFLDLGITRVFSNFFVLERLAPIATNP